MENLKSHKRIFQESSRVLNESWNFFIVLKNLKKFWLSLEESERILSQSGKVMKSTKKVFNNLSEFLEETLMEHLLVLNKRRDSIGITHDPISKSLSEV